MDNIRRQFKEILEKPNLCLSQENLNMEILKYKGDINDYLINGHKGGILKEATENKNEKT
jgi:hypothetical protein